MAPPPQDLTQLGANPPVGPAPRSPVLARRQAPPWKKRRRPRLCLLKGCGEEFLPPHPNSRYCSAGCREGARRWREWKARKRYRSSEKGKQRRRDQTQRRRDRQSRAAQSGADPVLEAPSVGHQMQRGARDFSCDRPGCYILFAKTRRSPHQRFCSASCRQALRRVRLREARWANLSLSLVRPQRA